MRLKGKRALGCSLWVLFCLAGLGFAGEPKTIADLLGQPKGKILILGVFHFEGGSRDTHKPKNFLDVFSEKRQKEIEEVTELLTKFKPTKVAVEWKEAERGDKTREEYQAYLKGEFELRHNEVYQLGFRLAKKMNHPQVYLVDAKGEQLQPWVDPEEYAKKHPGQERFFYDGWYEKYEAWWDHLDEAKTRTTLREHYLVVNDERAALLNHGVYLSGGFAYGAGDEYPKLNGFINRWYNRNLKIFANLVRITEKPDERIVLIIGNGHLGILQHLVKASPAYELVAVQDYLGTPAKP